MSWEGWLERNLDYEFDLFDASEIDLDNFTSGAYILRAKTLTKPFLYPGGRSKVFYIGKADGESGRLASHFNIGWHVSDRNDAEGQFSDFMIPPLYNYAWKFNARLMWISTRGTQMARNLEKRLLRDFWAKYGALPVANLRR